MIRDAYERLSHGGTDHRDIEVIATDAYYSCNYAIDVLKGRFIEGEKVIATNPNESMRYALMVLEGPFTACNSLMATDANLAYNYAVYALKNRFKEGEDVIRKSKLKTKYERHFDFKFESVQTTVETKDFWSGYKWN